jgi:hypothetical protein
MVESVFHRPAGAVPATTEIDATGHEESARRASATARTHQLLASNIVVAVVVL